MIETSRRQGSLPVRAGYLTVISAVLVFFGACGGGDGSRPGDPEVPPTDPGAGQPPPGLIAAERVYPLLLFQQPLALLQSPGDGSRWYVVEKQGVIRVFDDTPSVATSRRYLDIELRVDATAGEGGLLGMVFHPDFTLNRQVYVNYTAPLPFRSVISRFTEGPSGVLDPASETVLLEIPQPFPNHNGGHLAFGPEGFLYIGLGDGGSAGDPLGNGQDTTTLAGSILRIDVDGGAPYAIPPENPFAGNTECAGGSGTQPCPEIFAWGFRNPWRFSFDRVTGELWVGDVGQSAWEEVDRVTGGLNYGWNEREGANCYPPGTTGCALDNVDPVTEYPHGVGSSVTGGYVYRGSAFPGLEGQYLFGDFVSGRIWRVPADAPQGTAPVTLADTNLGIASFGESSSGEIYAVDFAGGLYRIVVP